MRWQVAAATSWADPVDEAGAQVAAGLGSTWWQYLLLFLAVAASWAGVPVIGTTALGAAAVAASQRRLDLVAVIVVAVIAGEAGGLGGYVIGRR